MNGMPYLPTQRQTASVFSVTPIYCAASGGDNNLSVDWFLITADIADRASIMTPLTNCNNQHYRENIKYVHLILRESLIYF
jgi:hypothetical protein